MDAMVTNISHAQNDRICRLPLKVQRPVFRVRELALRVVTAKKQRAASGQTIRNAEWSGLIDDVVCVRDESLDRRKIAWWWGRSRCAKRVRERRART